MGQVLVFQNVPDAWTLLGAALLMSSVAMVLAEREDVNVKREDGRRNRIKRYCEDRN